MGLFRQLGRQVERFTTTAKTAAEEHADYHCDNCGTRFSDHHTECPECGAETLTQESAHE
jgi:rRNA maturation endonuclease Nob1